jgi:NDP-sugar pyrophosphorylase family protein
LAPAEDRERFGSVEVDAEGHVVAFHEKAERGEGSVNAGIYLIERDVVRGIRGRSSLERDVFPGLVGKGLYAITGSSGLVDIGTPDALAQAEHALVEEFDELERFA